VAGVRIDLASIRRWIDEASAAASVAVIETAGGLFSPLAPGLTNFDLARALRPNQVVLVAADRLGILHDVTSAMGLAAARGLAIDVVVLSTPDPPDPSTGTNAAELEQLDLARPAATFPRLPWDAAGTKAAAQLLIAALETGSSSRDAV
jgi:dethiobiotin synthetase